MILFYSEFCQHCNVLLETISRHDKDKKIKTVSIDLLRTLNKPIDPKIQSVPALLLLNTKEYLFGKAVFDYLLLPNRGVLFSGQSSREDKKLESTLNNPGDPSKENIGEPLSFSLGTIMSDKFSPIDENESSLSNNNYSWDVINETESTISQETIDKFSNDDGNKKNLPSMEDIMKQRAEFN
jgi:hypothetical protein